MRGCLPDVEVPLLVPSPKLGILPHLWHNLTTSFSLAPSFPYKLNFRTSSIAFG